MKKKTTLTTAVSIGYLLAVLLFLAYRHSFFWEIGPLPSEPRLKNGNVPGLSYLETFLRLGREHGGLEIRPLPSDPRLKNGDMPGLSYLEKFLRLGRDNAGLVAARL